MRTVPLALLALLSFAGCEPCPESSECPKYGEAGYDQCWDEVFDCVRTHEEIRDNQRRQWDYDDGYDDGYRDGSYGHRYDYSPSHDDGPGVDYSPKPPTKPRTYYVPAPGDGSMSVPD